MKRYILIFVWLSQTKNKNNKRRPKCGAWRQNGGRLGDVMEAGRPVLRGLEVILQILRLGGHFYGDHGASAPPPSYRLTPRSKTYSMTFSNDEFMMYKGLYNFQIYSLH